MFNKKATQQLKIWLDSQFKFMIYINKKIKKAYTIEIQIKGLIKIYKLIPELIQ